jgi:D-amino-acid dehydrogenase
MRILILGAGVIGTASAWFLARDGHEVEVIERREAAGLETSWGNGGIIHASSVQPWAAPGMPRKILGWLGKVDAPMLLRLQALPHMWRWGLGFLRNCAPALHRASALANLELAFESLARMAEIRAETGIEYDFAKQCVLKTYPDRDYLDGALAAHDWLMEAGLTVERLDRDECVAMEPALAPVADRFGGGLYFPQDELGDCNKFTQGLAAILTARGTRFRYRTEVKSLEVKAGVVQGAVTASGERIAADAVVVALGCWTPFLLRTAGLDAPIYPVKGVSMTAPRAPWPGAPRTALLDEARKFGLVPIGDRIRIAGSAEITGYDTTPDPARLRAVTDQAVALFPELRRCFEHPDARPWAGLRPATPSGRPIIGPTAVRNLYINSGHGHTGWTLACGSGHRLANIVAGRPPTSSKDTVQLAAAA